ncbi:class I SAM-dependent methyltransferase [Candidatus Uhrbacteria bacterium]|nr:class I SAM-dependent methyltransferase [Candidatus Uhrbacteria bacterium]
MDPTAIQYNQFATFNPLFRQMNRSIIDTLQKYSDQSGKTQLTIVEYGAGPGVFTNILCKKFPKANIVAIEQNTENIESLQQFSRKNLSIIQRNMVFYEHSTPIDCAILRLSYHHIPDPQKRLLLRRIRKQLRHSGMVIIVDECLREYKNSKERLRREQEYHSYRIELAQNTNDVDYIQYQKDVYIQTLCPYKASPRVIIQQLRDSGFHKIHSLLLKTQKKSINDALLGHYCITARK